jgi:hypothetical protein
MFQNFLNQSELNNLSGQHPLIDTTFQPINFSGNQANAQAE